MDSYRRRLALLVFACALFLAGCAGRGAAPPPAGHGFEGHPGMPLVVTARSQIGTPYAYGGYSPDQGFDCSGFVWWVHAQNGLDVPRTAHELWAGGRFVPPGERQPGDVAVFRTGGKPKDLHVGIVTERGTIVHSPKTGAVVREEPMTIPYWSSRYLGSKRFHPEFSSALEAQADFVPAPDAP
ncbi:NLP/P60 protein [Alkalidesulfovibrio alkalitolerans DSM 16529]|uniref:NLP/P60 protein n=1 Tax=Alkalidesulfovibrio alkalitolerans DSM 16529 TaxID=1121439 RepID=S7T298_9BACT|nr:C40 family peptidase [Alkalidesulfovibrio alkalitolerans]EPR30640.1 NLP/P60 protein [Alkalidesulfovibrio alkalitolerans DSM 16529]